MPKYPPIPERLQLIDQLTVGEHYHVDLGDECYYLWERVSGRYDASETNQLISNLQITPAVQNQGRLFYKNEAIVYAAQTLGQIVPADWKTEKAFVPIPPSAVQSDPAYDNRLVRLLSNPRSGLRDVRELVHQRQGTIAKRKQIPPEERAENYEINESQAEPAPKHIVIFDDVLAGGSHFKAMKIVLQRRFPNVGLTGLFLARAIHPDTVLDLSEILNWCKPQ